MCLYESVCVRERVREIGGQTQSKSGNIICNVAVMLIPSHMVCESLVVGVALRETPDKDRLALLLSLWWGGERDTCCSTAC